MRKFKATSATGRFAGEIAATYSAEGEKLLVLDLTEASLSPRQTAALLAGWPASVAGLQACFGGSLIIVEVDFEVSFEQFYKAYPLQRNAYRTREVWPRLTKTDQVQAWASLPHYTAYCQRNQAWYKPMLSDRYLKERHFLTDWKKV